MKKLQLPIFLAVLTLLVLAVPGARGDSSAAVTNSGWYDHQIIQYKATAEVTSSPQAAKTLPAAMFSTESRQTLEPPINTTAGLGTYKYSTGRTESHQPS